MLVIIMITISINTVVMLLRALGGATYTREDDQRVVSGSGDVKGGSRSWDKILNWAVLVLMIGFSILAWINVGKVPDKAVAPVEVAADGA